MEIINLLLMLGSFYLLYNINFYIKTFLFFTVCILTSVFSENKNYDRLKEQDKKLKQLSEPIIKYSKSVINYFNNFISWFIELPIISVIYKFVENVNFHYVKGRNIIFLKMGERAFKLGPNLYTPINNRIVNEVKEVPKIEEEKKSFKNKEEMMLFLDNLLEKNK